MIRKVVFLTNQPLSAWNEDRFGIQTWLDRGWIVEVWDLTPLIQPRAWQDFVSARCSEPLSPHHMPITSVRDLALRLRLTAPASHYVDLTGDELSAVVAKTVLTRLGVNRVVLHVGAIPEPSKKEHASFAIRVRKAVNRGPATTIRWCLAAILRRVTARVAPVKIIVVSGESSLSLAGQAKILRAHNLDYDEYLRLRDGCHACPTRRIVFIDQDYCFHSDFLYTGEAPWATPKKYYPSILRGLRTASEALDLEVCIAAHPRAKFAGDVDTYFSDFAVIHGNTAEAIRDSSVVVCHDSTAVQYAVLFEKPIIFITTDELNASFAGSSIACFAAELGKSVINVDGALDAVDWQREMSIDMERYANYRERFIKSKGSQELPSWRIIIDHLEGSESDECTSIMGEDRGALPGRC